MNYAKEFPILAKKTYLASHSLGAVPKATLSSLEEYYRAWESLGIEAWDGPWWKAVEDFSRDIEFILGASQSTVVPMENATRAMMAVVSSLDFSGRRSKVVTTDLEFTTSYPFWEGMKKLGAQIEIIKSDDGGISVDPEQFKKVINEKTILVATSHVYFRSGALQNLKAIAEFSHAKGAYILGDGYQCVGTVPVNVRDLGVDFYIGGSHKWLCGGPGAGFLYVRPELISRLNPAFTGWFGLKNPFGYEAGGVVEPAEGVFRFLAGTPSVPALYAAREGIRTVRKIGVEKIRQWSISLTSFIIEQAEKRGMTIRTPQDPEARSGMVCLDFKGAAKVCQKLCASGIIVDYRENCGIRVSPHFYNTREDLEKFFAAVDGLV